MGCGASSDTQVDSDWHHKHSSYDNGDSASYQTKQQRRTPSPQRWSPSPPKRNPTPPPPKATTPPQRESIRQPRETAPPTPCNKTPPISREQSLLPPNNSTQIWSESPTSYQTRNIEDADTKITPPHTRQGSDAKAKEKDGYVLNEYGIYECDCYDFRQRPQDLDTDFSTPPTQMPFVDHDFTAVIAIEGEEVDWKRPGDIRDEPVLFSDDTTRYDIGQGGAGTCWFLSMVADLADRPKLFHRVVPMDAWSKVGGYFYCYFWRFGKWELVYIDDYLPVIPGTEDLWGAKSRDNRNEMWPSLIEKAFARFHGNYNAVYGGQSADAFLALTGGCSEYIDFDSDLKNDAQSTAMTKSLALHARLQNTCAQGENMLTCEVPEKFDKKFGLVGGHAYSLTDARTVTTHRGETVHLVRIRNPWGHTEWQGKWSDGSKEFQGIPDGSLPVANKDDGEFWMSLQDFIIYFSGVTVCSLIPDFDKDGCLDVLRLDFRTTIFGDWFGKNAAGFDNRINNPKYAFDIDDRAMDTDGKVPIVVQICQKVKHNKKEVASIRVDLYKVLGENNAEPPVLVMELLGTVTNVYKKERQMSNRYKVQPGTYIAVPSTITAGIEKEYLIRLNTPAPISNIRELTNCVIMQSDEFKPPKDIEIDPVIKYTDTVFGSWTSGYNAGGQVSNPTFYLNPQIEFEISQGGKALVSFTLMQDTSKQTYPIGMRVFPLESGYNITADERHQEYLYKHYPDCPYNINGQQAVFIEGANAEQSYVLQPGHYFVLLHADHPSQQTNFALTVRSTCGLNPIKHQFE